MAKVTDATLIRKAFGALSTRGKKAWGDAGLGKLHCGTADKSTLDAGLKVITGLGWEEVERTDKRSGSQVIRFRKNGADGFGADLTIHVLPAGIGLFTSYLTMDRAWCGL